MLSQVDSDPPGMSDRFGRSQEMAKAERFLTARMFSEAEKVISRIVKTEEEPDVSEPLDPQAAFILVQALYGSGRLRELKSVVPKLYGTVANFPVQATILWACYHVESGEYWSARELLEKNVLSQGDKEIPLPVLTAAARLYSIQALAIGRKDAKGAIKWVEENGIKYLDEGSHKTLLDELNVIAESQIKPPPQSSVFKPPPSSSIKQLPHSALARTPNATAARTSSYSEQANKLLTAALKYFTRGRSATSLVDLLIYMAITATLGYCVVVERHTISNLAKGGLKSLLDLVKMATGGTVSSNAQGSRIR